MSNKAIILTPYQRKALEIMREHGAYRNLSALGYMLFTERNGKRNPKPQGMALAASRFTRALEDHKLIRWDIDKGYMIAAAGSTLLANLEKAEEGAHEPD